MKLSPLTALSPLDGRYENYVKELRVIFSEFGLMKMRLKIEVEWLKALACEPKIKELTKFTQDSEKFLDNLINFFSEKEAKDIKNIENLIKHDIKAIEYFLQKKFSNDAKLTKAKTFIHFACTSDDINNLAYGLIIKIARDQHLLPQIDLIIDKLRRLAHKYSFEPMLARTHGQPASSTTLGKELANFTIRLQGAKENILKISLKGKMNGTVGNFNAHVIAYPKIDWQQLTKKFVNALGLFYNEYTTQIEPHDYLAEFCDAIARFNNILLGFSRDIWGYMALDYLRQKNISEEVGSSIMPHKINPKEFENSEGNLGIANAILNHLSAKLPISRWQRDLSDSTALRNLGIALSHSLLAYKILQKGVDALIVNKEATSSPLEEHWEILAEAVQTVMRRHGILEAYEEMKLLTRGKKISKKTLHAFIKKSALSSREKKRLLKLTPKNYLGIASKLAKKC